MRYVPGAFLSVLLCVLHALGTSVSAAVPHEAVLVNPPPTWVHPWSWRPPPRTTNETSDTDGVRVLLEELQDNPIAQEEYFRKAQLLENKNGVQDSGSLTISFDPSYQTLMIHHVRVHRAGAVFDRLNPAEVKVIQPEPGLWSDIYTGKHTAIVFVEDLRVGDVLEYAYTLKGANPIIGDHFSAAYLVQTYSPKDRVRLRVVWPSTRPLFLRQHLVEQAPRTNRWGKGCEYTWDWENVEALDYEDYQPPGNEPHPYVEFSDFKGWSRVVEWALPLYAGATDDLSTEAAELVSQWKQSTASDEQAALAALQFVQDELRYTGIELGPDSFRPAAPVQTLARRYGDCKAKSLLFCSLMHAMGIEAWPALVNTSSHEAVARGLPSPFAFNHVIVKLVLDGRPLWVDPTRSSQGGTLRNRYVPDYRRALLIKPGVANLEDIPGPGPDQRMQKVTVNFVLPDYESPASCTVTTVFRGAEADDMRDRLAGCTLTDIAEDYLNYYARYYPGITNAGPLEVHDEREINELTVIEKYGIADLWELDDDTGQWEASFYPDGLYGMLTDPDTRVRKMPLRISYPSRREHTVVVRLPEDGWDIPREDAVVEHSAFRLEHYREGQGNTVRFHYACVTLRREIPADEVSGYLNKLDEFYELLGDTLFRPDTSAFSPLDQINWLMVVLACVLLAIAAAGVVLSYIGLRMATPAAVDAPPPLLSEQRLCGLGGWLILVAIGLLLNPFIIVLNIGANWESFFSQAVWQEVALADGGQYHPLWGPLLIAELTGNIFLLGMLGLLLLLFFQKHRAFPKLYITFLMVNFCFIALDTLCAGFIPYLAEQNGPDSSRELVRATIALAIWGTYMVKSRRVKLTFVR